MTLFEAVAVLEAYKSELPALWAATAELKQQELEVRKQIAIIDRKLTELEAEYVKAFPALEIECKGETLIDTEKEPADHELKALETQCRRCGVNDLCDEEQEKICMEQCGQVFEGGQWVLKGFRERLEPCEGRIGDPPSLLPPWG